MHLGQTGAQEVEQLAISQGQQYMGVLARRSEQLDPSRN